MGVHNSEQYKMKQNPVLAYALKNPTPAWVENMLRCFCGPIGHTWCGLLPYYHFCLPNLFGFSFAEMWLSCSRVSIGSNPIIQPENGLTKHIFKLSNQFTFHEKCVSRMIWLIYKSFVSVRDVIIIENTSTYRTFLILLNSIPMRRSFLIAITALLRSAMTFERVFSREIATHAM